MQREALDYLRTSALTPAAASVKIVLAVANGLQYKVNHLDVAQAFTKATFNSRCTRNFPVVVETCLGSIHVSRRLCTVLSWVVCCGTMFVS